MCPWRAFHDPFVIRCYQALVWFEKGLDSHFADASARLRKGVEHLDSVIKRIDHAFYEQDEKKNEPATDP